MCTVSNFLALTVAAESFVFLEERRSTGRCLPIAEDQSQYAAELFAALEAIRYTNKNKALTIISTQAYVRDAMNKKLPSWEHEGWVYQTAIFCAA